MKILSSLIVFGSMMLGMTACKQIMMNGGGANARVPEPPPVDAISVKPTNQVTKSEAEAMFSPLSPRR